jgi:2-keto-4-pentenoate hydratase/2-oxohepta-3-ene-1,7-dioic acid hydratase in catechol pathway
LKLVSYQHAGAARTGVLDAERQTVHEVHEPAAARSGVRGLVEDGYGPQRPPRTSERGVPVAEVTLGPPLTPPRNVFCVGKNYQEHSAEFARSGFGAGTSPDVPSRPIFFTKPTSSIIGPDEPIDPHAALTDALDYEVELAVVIGVGGRGIQPEDVWQHVWGYTILNDVTARDLQRDHEQWFLGKSLDTFCPLGPWAVTADEVDATNLDVVCRVNGELRQKANTKDLIFDIPELVSTLSAGITLQPGDVIATGTPAGVGVGFDPPRFLTPGDVVELEITGLGTLVNPVDNMS